MKTFVFAIGGTGARVLRSLSMLMAMDLDFNDEIVPVLIDMDTTNGDCDRTLRLLDGYRQISKLAYTDRPTAGIFRNSCGTLGSVLKKLEGGTTADSGIKDSFQLDFGNVHLSFYEYIKGAQLNPLDADLLESLYDSSDSSSPLTELYLKLDKGFKGNPNIGSVVFNNLIDTPEFKHFENVFSQGDKIFIVSSIFGGTGSSGFPQLVKNIRVSNNLHVRNAPVAALVVQPYFRVKSDVNSSINSDTFNSKTKSALTYYRQELYGKINEMYYIGDRPGDAFDNVMGGAEQKNNAHVVELLCAKAIRNFANKTADELGGKQNYYEFGIKDFPNDTDAMQLGFQDFYNDNFWDKFAQFALIAKYYNDARGLRSNLRETFAKELDLEKEMVSEAYYVRLTEFMQHFWGWLQELELNKRSFSPFNLEGEFSKFFKGKNAKLDTGIFSDVYTKKMNEKLKALQSKDGKSPNRELFTKSLYQALGEVYAERVQQLPTR
jgi:hypothetical protein